MMNAERVVCIGKELFSSSIAVQTGDASFGDDGFKRPRIIGVDDGVVS